MYREANSREIRSLVVERSQDLSHMMNCSGTSGVYAVIEFSYGTYHKQWCQTVRCATSPVGHKGQDLWVASRLQQDDVRKPLNGSDAIVRP